MTQQTKPRPLATVLWFAACGIFPVLVLHYHWHWSLAVIVWIALALIFMGSGDSA